MGVLGLWTIIGDGGAQGGAEEPAAVSLTLAARYSQPPSAAASAAASSHVAAASSTIVAPSRSLSSSGFTNKLLAVDLSVWLMEAHSIARTFAASHNDAASGCSPVLAASSVFGGGPMKYHLQYIFQRACAFLRQSIRLVFVTDGRPPSLKARLATKDNQVAAPIAKAHKGRAPIHTQQIRDCATLLRLMDLPLLVLERGEAEALCGELNARGSIDGVLTPDGDCFLFGGRTILRNLEASQTSLAARVVRMSQIEATRGLDRAKLVLLALLLGSDYTSGVRGLGPRKAVKFLRVLEACLDSFERTAESAAAAVAFPSDPLIIRFFRILIQSSSPAAGSQFICQHHTQLPNLAASAVPAAAAASPNSPAVAPNYSIMSLDDLTAAMASYGLKPQSKLNMIAKLQQLQSYTQPVSLPAAPSAVTSSASAILISDSESDEEEPAPPAAAAAKPPGRKKRTKPTAAEKRRVSLQAFLTTYFNKIHARYHAGASQQEMEHILNSYLHPSLHPSVETLAQRIPSKIPRPHQFLELRSFCSTEMKLPFVKFENLWLPVLMHLDLWQREMDSLSQASEADDDEIMCSPPNPRSGLPRDATSATSAHPTCDDPLYIFSHVQKRRIIRGVPSLVLIWEKTARGRREIATIPRQTSSSIVSMSGAANNNSGHANDDESDDEVDMTVPSPAIAAITTSPLIFSNPVFAATAAAMLAQSSPSASEAPKLKAKKPSSAKAQDLDINLFETCEPVEYLLACHPHIVHQFEADEASKARQKEEAKEQAKLEKALERAAKRTPKVTPFDPDALPKAKPTATRAPRKKKGAVDDDGTPPITAFLSPIPTVSTPELSISAIAGGAFDDLLPTASAAPTAMPKAPRRAEVAPEKLPFRVVKSSRPPLPPPSQSSPSLLAKPAAVLAASPHLSKSPLLMSKRQSSPVIRESAILSSARVRDDRDAVENLLSSVICAAEQPPPPIKQVLSPIASTPFSSTLATCPLCDRTFLASIIGTHVNSCLDQQQLAADEELARGLAGPAVRAGVSASRVSSPPLPVESREEVVLPLAAPGHEASSDDEFDLTTELVLVPEEVPAVVPAAAANSAHPLSLDATSAFLHSVVPEDAPTGVPRSRPVTPKKRKAPASTPPRRSHLPRASPIVIDDDGSVIPRSHHAHHRQLITLDDSDEDEPGSTIYIKKQKMSKPPPEQTPAVLDLC